MKKGVRRRERGEERDEGFDRETLCKYSKSKSTVE